MIFKVPFNPKHSVNLSQICFREFSLPCGNLTCKGLSKITTVWNWLIKHQGVTVPTGMKSHGEHKDKTLTEFVKCVQEWQGTWRMRIWEHWMKVPHIIYFYILPQTAGHHHPKEGSHQNPKKAPWKDSGIWENKNTSCNSPTGNRLLKFEQDC